jgi:hypothetical protein
MTQTWIGYARLAGLGEDMTVASLRAVSTGYVLERALFTASADGQSDSLVQSCNVLSLGPGGQHPLVDCFSELGALVDGQIVSLPGFPSPSSSGISGQQAIAVGGTR